MRNIGRERSFVTVESIDIFGSGLTADAHTAAEVTVEPGEVVVCDECEHSRMAYNRIRATSPVQWLAFGNIGFGPTIMSVPVLSRIDPRTLSVTGNTRVDWVLGAATPDPLALEVRAPGEEDVPFLLETIQDGGWFAVSADRLVAGGTRSAPAILTVRISPERLAAGAYSFGVRVRARDGRMSQL